MSNVSVSHAEAGQDAVTYLAKATALSIMCVC